MTRGSIRTAVNAYIMKILWIVLYLTLISIGAYHGYKLFAAWSWPGFFNFWLLISCGMRGAIREYRS